VNRHAAHRDLQLHLHDSRERQLFKNIVYLGALAALNGARAEAIAELIGEQYKGKEKLLKPNLNALQLGLNYARGNLKGRARPEAKRAYAVKTRSS